MVTGSTLKGLTFLVGASLLTVVLIVDVIEVSAVVFSGLDDFDEIESIRKPAAALFLGVTPLSSLRDASFDDFFSSIEVSFDDFSFSGNSVVLDFANFSSCS